MKEADRYLKIVEWSEGDRCYVGTCPGVMLGGVHGRNEVDVYRELGGVVDEWLALLKKDGKPLPEATAGKSYSGKFVVRVGPDLHKALAVQALKAGESLNALCQRALRESLAPEKSRTSPASRRTSAASPRPVRSRGRGRASRTRSS